MMSTRFSYLLLLLLPVGTGVLGANRGGSDDTTAPCICSDGHIPVPVDVVIPRNATNPLGLNTTDNVRYKATLNVFGQLCVPKPSNQNALSDSVQLLLHGNTYNYQYWDVRWNGYQNYSYVSYACAKGIPSFAYDQPGTGQSYRPPDATHTQMPVISNVSAQLARFLKDGTVSQTLLGVKKQYQKVIGYGHSLGSATLNYAAFEGAKSPFDGLMLTGHVHDPANTVGVPVDEQPCYGLNPEQWPINSPGYVTTPTLDARYVFFGPNNDTFNNNVRVLDFMTEECGIKYGSAGIKFVYAQAKGFKGMVTELVGSDDEAHCLPNNNTPCDSARQTPQEKYYWPDVKKFAFTVIQGFGHSITLTYGGAQANPIFVQFFKDAIA